MVTKKSQGFTLIEVIIATAILVMVGVAAVGVERNFMISASTQKHRLQATGLAQEGISAVRRAFNNNLLNPANPALVPNTTYIVNADGSLSTGVNQTITPPPGQNGVTFTRTITVKN